MKSKFLEKWCHEIIVLSLDFTCCCTLIVIAIVMTLNNQLKVIVSYQLIVIENTYLQFTKGDE